MPKSGFRGEVSVKIRLSRWSRGAEVEEHDDMMCRAGLCVGSHSPVRFPVVDHGGDLFKVRVSSRRRKYAQQ